MKPNMETSRKVSCWDEFEVLINPERSRKLLVRFDPLFLAFYRASSSFGESVSRQRGRTHFWQGCLTAATLPPEAGMPFLE